VWLLAGDLRDKAIVTRSRFFLDDFYIGHDFLEFCFKDRLGFRGPI